jgi:hypothetical protein
MAHPAGSLRDGVSSGATDHSDGSAIPTAAKKLILAVGFEPRDSARAGGSSRSATRFSAPRTSPCARARPAAVIIESI